MIFMSLQLETRELKKNRQSIIIVASLIDNTPNIAGLVRTSEIFNVEAVCSLLLSIILCFSFSFLFFSSNFLLVN